MPSSTPSNACILVVDDDRGAADSLAALLSARGRTVHCAYGSEEALEAASSLRPDVIVLDIGMPRLNGYEVCRRLRSHPSTSHSLIVAVTGWGDAEDRRRGEAAGFDHHLVKPVDGAVLDELLQGKRTDLQ